MHYGPCLAFASILLAGIIFSSDAFANPPKPAPLQDSYSILIKKHAHANGVPLDLARAVVKAESSFNPRATGAAGEIGLMQIKLSTARGLGYRGSREELYDPAINITYGMKYLGQAHKLAGGSECGTLSRYNGGHGTKRMIKGYCKRVLAARDRLASAGS